MRTLCAIGVAFLIACAVPATGRADAPGPGGAPAAKPAKSEPDVQRRAVRPRRHVRHHVRYHVPPPLAAVPVTPVYYNPALPYPWDSAYERGMVLHFTSPPVSGLYRPEPGYPPTPPIVGWHYYRVQSGPVVYQYDGLIGEYVQLARNDPAHGFVVAAAPPAPPPPPPVPRGERG